MSALVAEPLSRAASFEQIRWLWEPYLARGKLALLDGHPGVGKSLVTIDLAARLSRGGELPGGVPSNRPHVTLLLSAEDGPDVIRPRAEAAGADLDWIVAVCGAGGGPLCFPRHLPDLEEQIRAHRADLVVIDPIMAFLPPEVAANLDQCVRRALNPLAAIAERTDCAILLVRHLRKLDSEKAILRGQGSMGIIAAARTGLIAAKHPADPSLGVLAVAKSNVAGSVPSLGYRVKPDAANRPVVDWVGVASLSADALGVSPVKPEKPLRARDWASVWLLAELANGPRRVTELLAAGALAGIPEITLRRAKGDAQVRAQQIGEDGVNTWYWYDPAAAWPADAPFRKPRELPPLPPLT